MYDTQHSSSHRRLQTPAERFASYRYPKGSLLLLGKTMSRTGQAQFFGLLPEDRLRHVWLIGKTGVGKSTLLAGLLAQDVARGEGVAVMDPHGALVEATLSQIPPSRLSDVVLIRPSDRDHPVAFNVFRQGNEPYKNRSLLASVLISTFKAQWSDSWGPRLENLLRHAILAVAEHPEASLTLLYQFLVDDGRQKTIVRALTDKQVQTFWQQEWPSYTKSLRGEALSPVLNKLGAFLGNPMMRAMVGHHESRLDFTEFIERKRLVLVDLGVGKIGEDASHLLGGLILSSLALAAMARTTRTPAFSVYIDEFHRVVNAQLPMLLAESRKFGLSFILAHQYLEQVPKGLKASLFGNVGTTLAFRVGPHDAKELEALFAPMLSASDLAGLGAWRMGVKQLARGEALPAFIAETLPPLRQDIGAEERIAAIVAQSRIRYSSPPRSTPPTRPPADNDTPIPKPKDPFTWS